MAETAVLALGGNALTREDQRGTLEEQYANALAMALSVRSLIRKGWNVVIVHGNGPQVGNLAIQHEGSIDLVPALPLFTLGAMTQGQLGSLICLALNEACKQEISGAVSIITHVEVDPNDPGLSHPTKPIGPFFERSEADSLAAKRGWTMVEDSGRGYRRVVPSPRPMAPIEADAVAAQALVMVTGVAAVHLHFGTPRQQAVAEMTASEARLHLADGQFPPGSMGPKVEAAIEFVESPGRVSAITTPELVYATLDEPGGVIAGPRGTRIVPDPVPALLS